MPLSIERVRMPGPGPGQLALVLDVEAVGQPVVEAGEEPAQLLGQGHEGPDRLGDVGGRHVDGVGDEVAGQRQQHLLGDGHPGLVLRLSVDAPRCGVTTTGRARTAASRSSAPWRRRRARAPPTMPSRMASASASSSMIPPRAALTIRRAGLALPAAPGRTDRRSPASSAGGS